jgi:multidrug efflux pump subunit AcrB
MMFCGMLDLCRIIIGIVLDLVRPRAALEAEILVLRQQIIVLRRGSPSRVPLPVSVAIGQHRLDHLQSGVRAQVVLKIFGEDLETLRRLAETARERLAKVPGLVDLQIEKQVMIPQLRIQMDYERAALYGLTPAGVTQALETLANGRTTVRLCRPRTCTDGPLSRTRERRSR